MSKKLKVDFICEHEGRDDRKNFIFDNWLKTYRQSPYVKGIASDDYYPGHRKLVDLAIHKEIPFFIINPDEPDQLYGFAVMGYHEDIVLHYIYVKPVFNGMGLAKQFFEVLPESTKKIIITHKTKSWEKFASKSLSKYEIEFNPYLFYELQGEDE